jgi:hypothetical protein
MGVLKSSKAHALATNENSSNKFKQKFKGKKDLDLKKDRNPKSTKETSNPKGGNQIRRR